MIFSFYLYKTRSFPKMFQFSLTRAFQKSQYDIITDRFQIFCELAIFGLLFFHDSGYELCTIGQLFRWPTTPICTDNYKFYLSLVIYVTFVASFYYRFQHKIIDKIFVYFSQPFMFYCYFYCMKYFIMIFVGWVFYDGFYNMIFKVAHVVLHFVGLISIFVTLRHIHVGN